jgi:hypothetical protein
VGAMKTSLGFTFAVVTVIALNGRTAEEKKK